MQYYKLKINTCTEEGLTLKGMDNVTCASEVEIHKVISDSYLILNIMSQYFNSTMFGDNPIKRDSKVLYFNFGIGNSFTQELLISKT
jgi:hypothetical protein